MHYRGLNNTGMGSYFIKQSYYRKQKDADVCSMLNKKLFFSQISESAYKIELKNFLPNRSLVKTHIFNQVRSMQSSAYVSMLASNQNIIQAS